MRITCRSLIPYYRAISRFPAARITCQPHHWLVLLLLGTVLALQSAGAAGTWTPLANQPPSGLSFMLLLSDGTVLSPQGSGTLSLRLTPDSHGSYVNGTWSTAASMHDWRTFYSSQVLPDGRVFVAGGEYGPGENKAEIYDPVANTWTQEATPPDTVIDNISETLPNGNILEGSPGNDDRIYYVASNTWSAEIISEDGGDDESSWVKLQDGSILGFANQNAERFIPALNQWVADTSLPVELYGYGYELGAGFLLPTGQAIFFGGSGTNAIYTPWTTNAAGIYTPAGTTNAGTWTVVANTPNFNAPVDAPAAMMVNGKIICAMADTNNSFGNNTIFYEYDYLANTFTLIGSPTGGNSASGSPDGLKFLDMPDGTVLLWCNSTVYSYNPGGTPLTNGTPAILSVTMNADGSYHLAGTLFNGITEGAAFGDDWQMNSDYPVARLTDSSGDVFYCRTFNWSTCDLMTGTNVVTTEMALPPTLPSGTYSLEVTANGNASAPVNLTYSPLSAPSGLAAATGNAQLGLSWNAVSGATGYTLLRSTTSGAYFVPVATVSGTNYTDTGLVNGMTYYYVVRSLSSGGLSDYSSQASGQPVGPPPVPAQFTASGAYQQVVLTWDLSFEATNYLVGRSLSSGGTYTIIGNAYGPGYNDTSATPGTTYYYEVSAVGPNGTSTTAPLAATPFTVAGGTVYEIVNPSGGGYALDDPNGGGSGTGMDQVSYSGLDQQWVMASVGSGHYEILSALNGLALTATNTRSQLSLLPYTGANDQLWTLTANGTNYNIGNVGTGDNIDDWGGGAGKIVGDWDASTSNANQQWALLTPPAPIQGVYKIVNLSGGGYALDDPNGGGSGTGVNQVTYAGVDQQWVIQSAGGGYYEILSAVNGLSLTAVNIEAQMVLQTFTGANNQLWTITTGGNTNGTFNLNNIGTGENIDDWGGGSGTIVGDWDASTSNANQQWTLTFLSQSLAPAAPTGLGATAGNAVVNLAWTQSTSPGITTNKVYRSTSGSGGPYNLLASRAATTSYSDTAVVNGSTYFYTVTAVNANGESAQSAYAGATPAAPPATPTGLTASTGQRHGTIKLTWNASTGATSYNVKRSTVNGGPYTTVASPTTTTYTDSGLNSGQTYYYVVSAVNASGESANSTQASAKAR